MVESPASRILAPDAKGSTAADRAADRTAESRTIAAVGRRDGCWPCREDVEVGTALAGGGRLYRIQSPVSSRWRHAACSLGRNSGAADAGSRACGGQCRCVVRGGRTTGLAHYRQRAPSTLALQAAPCASVRRAVQSSAGGGRWCDFPLKGRPAVRSGQQRPWGTTSVGAPDRSQLL